MKQIDIGEAAERLEELIEKAARSEPFLTTRHGEALVRVEPADDSDAGEHETYPTVSAGSAGAP